MGEYAERKSDSIEVKIGTCESMYYLRYEDRDKVRKLENSLDPAVEDGLFFRVPFPDEDKVKIGEYENHLRGQFLSKDNNWFSDPETVKDPGLIQLRDETSGLMANIPCFHGEKLPDSYGAVKFFWNGRGHHFQLVHIKKHEGKLYPIVRCQGCNKMWRYDWDDIIPYVYGEELQSRLIDYSKE